jgi:hypothetical protein
MSFSEQVALDTTKSTKHTISAFDASVSLNAAKRQRRDFFLVRQILELASNMTVEKFVQSQLAM